MPAGEEDPSLTVVAEASKKSLRAAAAHPKALQERGLGNLSETCWEQVDLLTLKRVPCVLKLT